MPRQSAGRSGGRIPAARLCSTQNLDKEIAIAAVDEGQVGLLNVGNVQGTMSH